MPTPTEGARFGNYLLLELVDKGGQGEVWKARDDRLGRIVALKILRRDDPGDLERLCREARAAAALDHPRICKIFEFSRIPPFIAMAFVEGVPIDKFSPAGVDPLRERVTALRDAAQAIGYAHTSGLFHRDLKPQNILVDRLGHAYVIDFGLAKHVGGGTRTALPTLTRSGQLLGTPAYMAPEQARGDASMVNEGTDVYGLGAVLYHLLAGRPPHQGKDEAEVLWKVQREDPKPPPGPKPLVRICLQAIRFEPERRYPTVEALAQDLTRWLSGGTILARRASALYMMRRRLQRHPLAWALGGMLFIALLVGGTVSMDQWLRARASDRRIRSADLVVRAIHILAQYGGDNEEEASRAIPLLDEAILLDPENAEAHYQRAEALSRFDDDVLEAFDDIDMAIRLGIDRPEAFLLRGDGCRFEGDLGAATSDYSRAIVLDPYFTRAYQARAFVRERGGDTAGAVADLWFVADYGRTHDLDHGERSSRTWLPTESERGGLLWTILSWDPWNVRAHVEEAITASRWDPPDLDSAVAHLDAALSADPWNARARRWRARARLMQGRFLWATWDMVFVLGGPGSPFGWLWSARVHARAGDMDRSLGDYDKAIALAEPLMDPVAALVERARLLRDRAEYEAAIADFGEAIVWIQQEGRRPREPILLRRVPREATPLWPPGRFLFSDGELSVERARTRRLGGDPQGAIDELDATLGARPFVGPPLRPAGVDWRRVAREELDRLVRETGLRPTRTVLPAIPP